MVSILTVFAGLIALTAAYVYFIGIPPEMKRKLEQQALRTMGENKMSYVVKGMLHSTVDCKSLLIFIQARLRKCPLAIKPS